MMDLKTQSMEHTVDRYRATPTLRQAERQLYALFRPQAVGDVVEHSPPVRVHQR
jgi:hypothetical protein